MDEKAKGGISRRRFLKMATGATTGMVLAACGVNVSGTTNPGSPGSGEERVARSVPAPLPLAEKIPDQVGRWLEAGRGMKTGEDVAMLDGTWPGVDLTFFGNKRVEAIRAIPDTDERIVKTIGFLEVERSRRYSWMDENGKSVYACNIYLLDALRLLLKNDVIGSRYEKLTGEPWVIGLNNLNWSSAEAVRDAGNSYPFLDSNNLDWWMEAHGRSRGWEKIKSREALSSRLKEGFVGMGVTPHKKVREGGVGFVGHAFLVCSLGGLLGISQSTVNTELKVYPENSTESKINPRPEGKYNFWVHKLPAS